MSCPNNTSLMDMILIPNGSSPTWIISRPRGKECLTKQNYLFSWPPWKKLTTLPSSWLKNKTPARWIKASKWNHLRGLFHPTLIKIRKFFKNFSRFLTSMMIISSKENNTLKTFISMQIVRSSWTRKSSSSNQSRNQLSIAKLLDSFLMTSRRKKTKSWRNPKNLLLSPDFASILKCLNH